MIILGDAILKEATKKLLKKVFFIIFHIFSARTTLTDGLIFYGRAESEDAAILKCCQKAVKHLQKNQEVNNLNYNLNHCQQQPIRKRQQSSATVNNNRRKNESPRPPKRPPSSKASSRELELRSEMGDVLDRVSEWSRRYESRNER